MTALVLAPASVAGQGWEAALEEIAERHEPGNPGLSVAGLRGGLKTGTGTSKTRDQSLF